MSKVQTISFEFCWGLGLELGFFGFLGLGLGFFGFGFGFESRPEPKPKKIILFQRNKISNLLCRFYHMTTQEIGSRSRSMKLIKIAKMINMNFSFMFKITGGISFFLNFCNSISITFDFKKSLLQ